MRNKKTHILILEKDDPEREAEFEFEFMMSLTQEQRYTMMRRLVCAGLKMKGENESQKTPTIVTRI